MTEAEWLAYAERYLLLKVPNPTWSLRKYRLFAAGCYRDRWERVEPKRNRRAVEILEGIADGSASEEELRGTLARPALNFQCADGYYNLADFFYGMDGRQIAMNAIHFAWESDRHSRVVNLVHDVFGNPFRPVALAPAWLTPNVIDLARTIYEERGLLSGALDRTRLAILADALMDAGCDSEAILSHCRSEGPHVRGCWVVDLILGKE